MGTPNNLLYAVARDLALCLDGLGGLGVSVGVGGLCLTVVVFLRGVGLLSGCPLGDGGLLGHHSLPNQARLKASA